MKKVVRGKSNGWDVKTTDPPILSTGDWAVANGLGIVFLVMAILQIVSFADFREILRAQNVDGPTAWAVGIIFAELMAAAGFFRLRLSYLARVTSAALALLAAGFWFVLNLQTISAGAENLTSSGLFGRFLNQQPGWWTALEVTVLLFWTMYAVALTRYTVKSPVKK